jgi:uncharacterized protein (DUF302 family)
MKMGIVLAIGMLLGLVVGTLLTGLAMGLSGEQMMIKEIRSPFDLEKTVSVLTQRINDEPGWHVVAVYNQQEEVKKYGDIDIGPMKIIEYCSGPYAGRMLSADNRKKIATILPKSFAAYEKSDGSVYIATMNGSVMGKLFRGEAGRIVERVSLDVEDMMAFIFSN